MHYLSLEQQQWIVIVADFHKLVGSREQGVESLNKANNTLRGLLPAVVSSMAREDTEGMVFQVHA